RFATLQDETHRTERAELVGVNNHATLLDLEGVAAASEHVAVSADIFADALVASIAVTDEIRGHINQIAVDIQDAHIGDQPPGSRLGKFRMAVGIEHANHPLPNALAVVRHQEKRAAIISVRLIVGWNKITCIIGKQRLPLVELPLIEQSSF